MSGLIFDPVAHTYTLDGAALPSVTTVIKAAGLMPPMFGATEWHMERGRLVHAATHMSDENDLDESSLDPEIAGRVQAWRAFRAGVAGRLTISEIERPRYHPALMYAGTPDRVGTWDAKPCVVDIKSGAPALWHRTQLGAYSAMTLAAHRLGVYLAADGSWKLVTYTDRGDWPVFQSALALWQYRARHGLLAADTR